MIKCECGCGSIRSLIGKHGDQVQYINGHYGRRNLNKGTEKGSTHPSWKGGKYITSHGYVMIKAYNHPRVDKNGYIFEHILVMEKHLGRFLVQDEIVHHINGNRQDNRVENLELMTSGQHTSHHNLHPGMWLHCLSCGILRYVSPHSLTNFRACSKRCNSKLTGLFNRRELRSKIYTGWEKRKRDAMGKFMG